MRSHGTSNDPDPKRSAHRVLFGDRPKTPLFISAASACKKLVPNDGLPSEAQTQATVTLLLTYTKCVRTHGKPNFPDLEVSIGGIQIALRGLVPTLPQYVTAAKACRKLARGLVG